MNPFHVLEDLQATYRLLVETFQEIANDYIRAWMHDRIEQGDFLYHHPTQFAQAAETLCYGSDLALKLSA